MLSKQYFSYFIETVALVQLYENGIPENWDPGLSTLWWDPLRGPGLGPHGGTPKWDGRVGP